MEVLGFPGINVAQQEYFNSVFSVINVIPISTEIIDEAIKLRRIYNLSVGDSIISATARILELNLFTNNVDDFKNIKELKISNPLSKN